MGNLTDTLLNIWVFAFVGLLVWLYFKDSPENEKTREQESDR
jgi:hypothetical protein